MADARKRLSRESQFVLVLLALLPVWYFLWQLSAQGPAQEEAPAPYVRCTACGASALAEPGAKRRDKCPTCGRTQTLELVSLPLVAKPLALADLVVRIAIGIVSFSAVAVLVVRGQRRRRARAQQAARQFAPCPDCGTLMRAKPEGDAMRAVCPDCGTDLDLASPVAVTVPAEAEDVSSYMKALLAQRQKRKHG